METFIVGILLPSLDDKYNKRQNFNLRKSTERKMKVERKKERRRWRERIFRKASFSSCFLSSLFFLDIVAKYSQEELKREKRKTFKK